MHIPMFFIKNNKKQIVHFKNKIHEHARYLKMTPTDPKTTVQAPQKDTHDHWNKVGGLLFAVFFNVFHCFSNKL